MSIMERYLFDPHFDISDLVDTEREWDIPNFDYTLDFPPIEGTTDLHPMDCRCLPCAAQREYLDWVDNEILDEDGERAYAEMLERRSERSTWFGPETEMDRDW